jgi:predicted  nucleic acid-binding Zn-ribbon protein
MNGTQDQTPNGTAKCSNCGRENAAARLFCQFCGHRIAARLLDEAALVVAPGLSPEVKVVQAALDAAQGENLNLHQLLDSARQELEKVKAANAKLEPALGVAEDLHAKLKSAEDKAATLESQTAGWEQRWKSAEEKAATFEKQLAAKAKEVEAAIQQKSGIKPQPGNGMKLIAGALAVVAMLGSFAAGRYVRVSESPKGRLSQLSSQLTNAQAQINTLQTSLDAANKKASQAGSDSRSQVDLASQQVNDLTTKLAARDAQQHSLDTRLSTVQRELVSTQTQLAEAIAKQRSIETASNQRVQQLEGDKQARDNEISTLRGRIASAATKPGPRAGSLIWSGTVVGKRKIDIKNGVPDYGTIVSGALPQKQCTVSTPDTSHVQLKTLPASKNQWNRVSFEVSGTGVVQVRINWVTPQ